MALQPSNIADAGAGAQAPHARVGEYDIHPLDFADEEAVAEVFVKVVQRGNPLLEGKPQADLLCLGRAMYRKSVPLGISQVVVHKGELVGVNVNWDAKFGGVWAGTGLEMPASLACHAEMANAVMACPSSMEDAFFAAFCGILPPHTGKLFGILGPTCAHMAHDLGFKKIFIYSLHPALVGRGFLGPNKGESNSQWQINTSEMAVADAGVKAELEKVPCVCQVSLTPLKVITGPASIQSIAKAVRATPEELDANARAILRGWQSRRGAEPSAASRL